MNSPNKSHLYKYINSKLSTRASFPPIRIYQNNVASNYLDKAKCFSDQFASVFTKINITTLDDNNNIFPWRTNKSPEIIRNHICLLPNKSNQSDNIPKFILRQLSYQLAITICKIFSKSLNSQICPESWKVGIIKTIFKKGDSTVASNYRLLTILENVIIHYRNS